MEQIPLAEYGVGLGAIVALVFIVVKFLVHLEKKDKTFTEVITNHLDDAQRVNEKLIASNDKISVSHDRLELTISRLIEKL